MTLSTSGWQPGAGPTKGGVLRRGEQPVLLLQLTGVVIRCNVILSRSIKCESCKMLS